MERDGLLHLAGDRQLALSDSGRMLATVDFNMFKIGCTATLAAVRYLHHEPLPEKVLLPADVIDKSNYKDWLVPVEKRACPDWAGLVK